MTRAYGLILTDPDPRSARFRMADQVASQPNVRKVWQIAHVLDQGQNGACVGFGYAAELAADPHPSDASEATLTRYAKELWQRARVIDGRPAEPVPPDAGGTTMLSGAKACVEAGAWDGYAWANSIEDVRNAVVGSGPVVIGIPWLGSMDWAAPRNHALRVDRSEKPVYAHCLLVNGYDPALRLKINGKVRTEAAFLLTNSWGDDWGNLWYWGKVRRWKWVRKWSRRKRRKVRRRVRRTKRRWKSRSRGQAWITATDLNWLLGQRGYAETACIPTGRRPVSID